MKERLEKYARVLAVFCIAAMAVSTIPQVLTSQPAAMNASAAPNIVKVGWTSEILIWNPLTIDMTEDYVACYLMYSSLFTYDQDWNGPVGDLALSWNQTEHADNTMTTWVNITHSAYFRAKTPNTWTTGPYDTNHSLTARDVAFTYNLIMNQTGGAWDFYLRNISKVAAVDSWTVRVDTDIIKATLIDDLANVPILPMYYWNDPRSAVNRNPLGGMNPTENLGSGPMYFDDWQRGSWYQFVKAPNYHGSVDYPKGTADINGERVVDVDGVLYKVYTDTTAMTLDMNSGNQDTIMLTGDVNLYNTLLGVGSTVRVFKSAVQEPGITDIAINAIPMTFRRTTGGGFGQGNPLLLDPWVRTAIMMTLNKTYIHDNIMGGLSTIADSVVAPGYWHYTPQNQTSFNPAAAKTLLENHGYQDTDADGLLEAQAGSIPVQNNWVTLGTELSGIRCQAPDTDASWGLMATAWTSWARDAGIGFVPGVKNEAYMVNTAWYKADYDIWVWHWGWGPEPLGAVLSVWNTDQIKPGGDNCQMPMGPWWYDPSNQTSSPTGAPYSAFDQNMSVAMKTTDKAARKVIVDKLQQWIYDSMTENPPNYDLGLYGYTDARYEGWGDWEVHNGRTTYSDLPWLWFSLQPSSNQAPMFDIAPATSYTVMVGSTQSFTVKVSDVNGDSLLVNWSFGESGVMDAQDTATSGTISGVTFTRSHQYNALGTYTMNVSVWDSIPGHEVRVSSTINVVSTPNLGPTIEDFTYGTIPPVYVGTAVTWTAKARDPESGTSGYGLKFTWDWNDVSFTVNHVTSVADNTNYTDTQTHSWSSPGLYNVKVSVWDGYNLLPENDPVHNVSLSYNYRVIENTAPTPPVVGLVSGIEGEVTPLSASSTDMDRDTITFTWNFGNGSYAVTQMFCDADPATNTPGTVISSVTHTWAAAGRYWVNVSVDDGQGHNVSTNITAVISTPGPQAPTFGVHGQYPSVAYVASPVWLNLSASDANRDALDWFVRFGDTGAGNTTAASTLGGSTGYKHLNVTHTYGVAGTYTVTVWVNDHTYNVSTSFQIVINAVPVNQPPTFQLQSSYSCLWNQSLTVFPSLLSDPDGDVLVVWYDWGDGGVSMGDPMGAHPYESSHVYKTIPTGGKFTITVSANDGHGHNVSSQVEVSISEANYKPSIVSMQVSVTKAKVGEIVYVNITVRDIEGDPMVLSVDFGDDSGTVNKSVTADANTDSTVQTFTHEYTVADVAGYKITATVKDDQDHFDENWASQTATVTVEKPASKGGISTAMLVGLIALIAIIAVIIAAVMIRRRKKPEERAMEGAAPPPEETPKQ